MKTKKLISLFNTKALFLNNAVNTVNTIKNSRHFLIKNGIKPFVRNIIKEDKYSLSEIKKRNQDYNSTSDSNILEIDSETSDITFGNYDIDEINNSNNSEVLNFTNKTTDITDKLIPDTIYEGLSHSQNKVIKFLYNNAINLNSKYITRGYSLFSNCDIKLVHILEDKTINIFRDGILHNNYNLYEKYINTPEFLFFGKSNVGKSSLINSLFNKNLTFASKTPGKTQKLEFFLMTKTINKKKGLPEIAFFIDAPGYGNIEGPNILKDKFKYLINTYLKYAVRLKMMFFLINGQTGMDKDDWLKLRHFNKFNHEITIVLTKIDTLSNEKLISNLKEISHMTREFENIRSEIIMVSSKTGFGIENFRSYIDFELEGMTKSSKYNQKEGVLDINV